MKKKILIGIVLLLAGFAVYFNIRVRIAEPEVSLVQFSTVKRLEVDSNFYSIKNNWLRQNEKGLWEMYVEGSPIELGVYEGRLGKELIYKQEEAFVNQMKQIVPSDFYLRFLRYIIGWFNRDIDMHVIDRYQKEIYGVSLSTSNDFDFIASGYQRMLNYHGAHDIGHALKDLAIVGCTSFIANQNRNDSDMVVGRNFDFYINDDFSKDKIIAFVSPDSGYQFAYITWASMIGVVSGMNTEGITVTINAAKSDIPSEAKTPISLLTREILQFSSNIEEAVAIAQSRDIFVSESILVASANDDMAVIIEKTPSKMGLYYKRTSQMVSSNHYQGKLFDNDENNIKNIEESASFYRQQRCEQLLADYNDSVSVLAASNILRDTRGLGDADIGLGNEKAMNQLISHHSVIFLPKRLQIWVSTAPYQLGEYLCYDLNEVFAMKQVPAISTVLYKQNLTIAEDTLLHSKAYAGFVRLKELKIMIQNAIDADSPLENDVILMNELAACDVNYFYTYELIGNYWLHFGEKAKAIDSYSKALSLEIANKWETERINGSLLKAE
ncbi:MAG: choloylglycine hydrolase [Bacteroidales bacterium]|nr:choloylglycine hydrolase [Bacteroidales bacterium]